MSTVARWSEPWAGGADVEPGENATVPVVRPARPDEVQAILRVWREADAAATPTDAVEFVARLIARGEGSLLIAEADGVVVGTLIAGWDGWRGNLYRLAVVPEHRRRGVGSLLVREGERRLRELGVRRISATVIGTEEPAIGFWRSAGYAVDDGVDRFVKDVDRFMKDVEIP